MGTRVQTVKWPVQKFALVALPFSRSVRSEWTSPQPMVTELSSLSVVASSTRSSRSAVSSALCQASAGDVDVSESAMAASSAAQARTVRSPVSPSKPDCRRSMSSARRPASSMSPLSTSSSGSVPRTASAAPRPWRRRGGFGPIRNARCWHRCARARKPADGGRRIPIARWTPGPIADPRQIVIGEAESPPHRLAPREIEDLAHRHPRGGEVEHLRQDAHHRVGLAEERSAKRILSCRVPSTTALFIVPAECRLDERREGLDVGAHDDDVARLELRVLLEQMQDGISQDLDLPAATMTRMDPDAVVFERQHRANVGVPAPLAGPVAGARSARTSSWIRCSRVRSPVRPQLRVARRVSAHRREPVASRGHRFPTMRATGSRVRRSPVLPTGQVAVWVRRGARGGCRVPATGEAGRGGRTCAGHGVEDVEIARREACQPEQRQPVRRSSRSGSCRSLAQARFRCSAGLGCSMRRAGGARARPARPPRRGAVRPWPSAAPCRDGARRSDRRGPRRAARWRSVAARAPGATSSLASLVTDVDSQRCQPGLVEVPFDDFHERPDGAFGHPRVRLRVVARGPGQRAGDHARERGR